MSTISSKIQLTAAVFAVATTATLAPVAFADPTDTDTGTATASSTDASVGSAAGQAPTRSNRKDRPLPTSQAGGSQASDSASDSTTGTAPSTDSATSAADDRASTSVDAASAAAPKAVGPHPLFQNPLIWFGQPNPTPPPSTEIYTFEPLANLPEFTRPMLGWMEDFNFEKCVLGLSHVVHGTVGPYGTATRSFSTSGCA